jgi:hypothetical protein
MRATALRGGASPRACNVTQCRVAIGHRHEAPGRSAAPWPSTMMMRCRLDFRPWTSVHGFLSPNFHPQTSVPGLSSTNLHPWTSVHGFSSLDFRPRTSVQKLASCVLTSCVLTSCVLPYCSLAILRPTSCRIVVL